MFSALSCVRPVDTPVPPSAVATGPVLLASLKFKCVILAPLPLSVVASTVPVVVTLPDKTLPQIFAVMYGWLGISLVNVGIISVSAGLLCVYAIVYSF